MDESLEVLRQRIIEACEGRDENDPRAMGEAYLEIFPATMAFTDAEIEWLGQEIIDMTKLLREAEKHAEE